MRAFLAASVLVAPILLAGCGSVDFSGKSPALTRQQVENTKYRVVHNGGEPFVLKDGRNDQVPTRVPDKTMSVAMVEPVAVGDLNDDGSPDALVVLVSSLGGSGSYVTLAVVENDRGLPSHTANAELGDRTRVKSIAVDGNVITVEVLRAGPADPLCCPTQAATLRYKYEGGRLNPQP